jgi:GT2 family glycosyltransferase
MKDINIVFVNYLCKEDIMQAIDSVVVDINDCPYEVQITVVDNSFNKDNIKQTLAGRYPQVDYVDACGNVGFGKGNTLGFQNTSARYYFALNRDTIIPASTKVIERLVRFMDDHPKVGAAGPKLLNMDGSLQLACYRFDFPSMFVKPFKQLNWDTKYKWARKRTARLLMTDFDHNKTQPVDWVLGAALVVRKEVVDQVGWFDKRYFMYLEDSDWCRSMWEKGWPVYYIHDIEIMHRHTRGSAKDPSLRALVSNRLARIHLLSWLKYMWKWRKTFKYYAE